ncbi:hypothetical protein [Jannaschia aquimarina]|uniref:Uncharacterized protein n=1 Tax=Jannaschia aquimarina TaxID=935700 RepID=A0A0D1EHR3_9RHOB|nr:hypothetical protein [Jannaschia aquimarina]KIT15355.1 hypothetical protein jaqu_29700 [Jannaschia aquimarina]SNS51948.1 hypothetical protein SAMN05421775_101284 [Jannaschia aquimarina]
MTASGTKVCDTGDDALHQLVKEAEYLCDQLLYEEADQELEDLVRALQPFHTADHSPTADEILALKLTFRKAYGKARTLVDGITLREVLKGWAPTRKSSSIVTGALLAVIGIGLMLSIWEYSSWSARTDLLLEEAEDFVEFEHESELMRLVELRSFFQSDGAREASFRLDPEPQRMFVDVLKRLESHYTLERTLEHNLNEHLHDLWTFKSWLATFHRLACRTIESEAPEESPATEMVARTGMILAPEGRLAGLVNWVETCAPAATGQLASQRNIQEVYAEITARFDDLANSGARFDEYIDVMMVFREYTMYQAGRRSGPFVRPTTYVQSLHQIANWRSELLRRLDDVHRWYLPILYGMLGSIVYAIWRVLTPGVAPLGRGYTILRTCFAGLAAMTLSMLLVPSNATGLQGGTGSPIIYLVAFVFGYSIEAFVRTLSRLNASVSQAMSPRRDALRKPRA